MCNHQYLHTNYSRICKYCGIESIRLELDTFNPNSAPLTREYNRANRFKNKVDRLLGISTPPARDPVWDYLETVIQHHVSLYCERALLRLNIMTRSEVFVMYSHSLHVQNTMHTQQKNV